MIAGAALEAGFGLDLERCDGMIFEALVELLDKRQREREREALRQELRDRLRAKLGL